MVSSWEGPVKTEVEQSLGCHPIWTEFGISHRCIVSRCMFEFLNVDDSLIWNAYFLQFLFFSKWIVLFLCEWVFMLASYVYVKITMFSIFCFIYITCWANNRVKHNSQVHFGLCYITRQLRLISKNVVLKKTLCPQYFFVRTILCTKWIIELKILGQKNLVRKNLDKKRFRIKKILGPKKFLS